MLVSVAWDHIGALAMNVIIFRTHHLSFTSSSPLQTYTVNYFPIRHFPVGEIPVCHCPVLLCPLLRCCLSLSSPVNSGYPPRVQNSILLMGIGEPCFSQQFDWVSHRSARVLPPIIG